MAMSAVIRRLGRRLPVRGLPGVTLAVTDAVGIGLVVLMTVLSAEIYDEVTEAEGIAGLDRRVLDAMAARRSPAPPAFPSGHALNSWVLLLLIGYLVALRVRSRLVAALAVLGCAVAAVAMGLSRVYLGRHWMTDMLVAWTLGSAWLAVVVTGHQLAVTGTAHFPANRGKTSRLRRLDRVFSTQFAG